MWAQITWLPVSALLIAHLAAWGGHLTSGCLGAVPGKTGRNCEGCMVCMAAGEAEDFLREGSGQAETT